MPRRISASVPQPSARPSRDSAPRSVAIANRHPRLHLDRRAVARVIHVLDSEFPNSKIENRKSKIPTVPPGELSLVFLTDPALAKLHADFLSDSTITDVITFEGSPALGTAGEICVSVDAALRHLSATSRSQLSRPSPLAPELTLYLVHGWLHLAGYDDLAPAKKRAMRRAEARALRLLRAASAIPPFSLRR